MAKAADNGSAIVLGAMLDGIPESVVLGSTLIAGGAIGLPFLAAVAISNVPEALSAAADLRREGHRPPWIIGLWVAVAVVSGIASALGYALLGGMGEKAFQDGGDLTGLATVFGFATAFLLSTVT